MIARWNLRAIALRRLLAVAFALCLLTHPTLRADATNAAATAPQPVGTPSFFTTKTRLWRLRSQIICFQVPQPAAQDSEFPCKIDDKFVHILVPPRVLSGEKIGYLRVQPGATGQTQIDVDGAKIDIDIADDPAAPRIADFAPRIVSPASGADVWGDFSVGVEQLTLGDPAKLSMPVLRLPDGREITGHIVPSQGITKYGRWAYDLNASELKPGHNKLVAAGRNIDGSEILSNEIEVNAVTPSTTATFTGFCRDHDTGDRPYKSGDGNPRMMDDKDGHGSVVDDSSTWCLPLWIDQPGVYQLFLTARGQIGGDGLPTLGMSIDEAGARGATAARLATTEWRRVPVGHPIVLDAGGHMLNLRLGNYGSGRKPNDFRDIWLDKYEIARVDPPRSNLAEGNGADPTLPVTGNESMSMMEAAVALEKGDVHVVFTGDMDGRDVAGPLEVTAQCWWPDQKQKHAEPPTVELYVNQKLVSTQKGPQPKFTIDLTALVPGANTLQLRAMLPSGAEAKSIALTVNVPKDFPLPSGGNAAAPRLHVAYAPQEIGVGKTDAVVAQVMDGRAVATADLLIDGQAQHLDQSASHGLGSILLPLLARDLKPGSHRLQVIAHDNAGGHASSPETTFTVSDKAPALSRYDRAVFLLNRFAYGPESDQLAAVLTEGETAWLTRQLSQGPLSAGEQNEQEWMRNVSAATTSDPSVTFPAIEYLLTDSNPVRARFLMWTENHFSTWIRKEGYVAKGEEHRNFLRLGPAPFFDLLFTSATSPGMLVYLDQKQSVANHLNENYAREIMELHTLGVNAGYTQTDVTTFAGLLAGWTLSDEAPGDGSYGGRLDTEFGYDPNLNNGKECRVFGFDFPAVDPTQRFDRVMMALEMLTAHPSCAAFISRKLCEEYVSDPAPPELVDALAKVYLETGGDISAMLVAMSQHPAFWAAPPKITTPIDFSVRTCRLAGRIDPGPVQGFITASGMGMFERPTPDGYPEDNGYSMSTNSLLQRWRFSQGLETNFLQAGLVPAAWHPADTAWDGGAIQRMIDFAAVRITGHTLGAASNEAAQKLVASAPADTGARLRVLASFICQVPENCLK